MTDLVHAPAVYLDSEQVKEVLRAAIAALGERDFDWNGDEALPLRPDVRQFAVDFLCRPTLGPLRAGGLPLPQAVLLVDGTLVLRWRLPEPGRMLLLRVCCTAVLLTCRVPALGAARIEGVLRGADPVEVGADLDRLFDWLRRGA